MEQKEISLLIQSIDAAPDPLHGDLTPSVLKLMDRGLSGAVAALPLLNAPSEMTRRRASRVIEGAVARHFGFREGRGFPDAKSGRACRQLLSDARYQVDAPESERIEAMERWRKWLVKHTEGK